MAGTASEPTVDARLLLEDGRPVLVTGATGFTGRVLTRSLLAAGVPVRILVRNRDRAAEFELGEESLFCGDLGDPELVDRAVGGCGHVFNLAASYREGGAGEEAYHRVHVTGAELLVRAAVRHGVRRFLHCSTVGVHGHIEEPPADETYRFSPGDVYQRTKLAGEESVRAIAAAEGLAFTVVRPTAIFGPEDERLLKLFKISRRDPAILLGNGAIFYHLVHVSDLVRGIILAATHPAGRNEVFILGGEGYVSLNELVRLIARLLGKKGRILHLPAKPVQWLGSLCEAVCIPLGLNPPIYRRRVDFFTKSRAFQIEKAKRLLGYAPQVSLEEGLRDTLDGYRAAGWM